MQSVERAQGHPVRALRIHPEQQWPQHLIHQSRLAAAIPYSLFPLLLLPLLQPQMSNLIPCASGNESE